MALLVVAAQLLAAPDSPPFDGSGLKPLWPRFAAASRPLQAFPPNAFVRRGNGRAASLRGAGWRRAGERRNVRRTNTRVHRRRVTRFRSSPRALTETLAAGGQCPRHKLQTVVSTCPRERRAGPAFPERGTSCQRQARNRGRELTLAQSAVKPSFWTTIPTLFLRVQSAVTQNLGRKRFDSSWQHHLGQGKERLVKCMRRLSMLFPSG